MCLSVCTEHGVQASIHVVSSTQGFARMVNHQSQHSRKCFYFYVNFWRFYMAIVVFLFEFIDTALRGMKTVFIIYVLCEEC